MVDLDLVQIQVKKRPKKYKVYTKLISLIGNRYERDLFFMKIISG